MSLRRNIQHSFRVFRSSPLLFSIAALSLGLGIFVSLSTFEIANLILFRPLPFRDSDRLAVLHRSTIRDGQLRSQRFPAEQVQQLETSDVVETTWFDQTGSFFLPADDGPTRITYIQYVDPKIFRVLGVTPLLGPGVSLSEQAEPEMLLSHRLWKSHFGGSQDIIGLRLRGRKNTSYTVVGIMPPELRRLSLRAEAWVPRRLEAGSRKHLPIVLVRLKEGLSIRQAEAALKIEHERFESSHSGSTSPSNVFLEPLGEALADGELTIRRPARHRSLLLLGLGALVLILSCSNAGHAMVLLGARRQLEFAIRASLGATRADLVRQIVVEAAVLIGTATIFVGSLRTWLWSALVQWLPYTAPAQGERLPWLYQLPIWETPELSSYGWLALLISIALSLLTIGLWPAIRLLSKGLAADLRSGGSVGMGRPGKRRLTQLFVATQVALTFVVLLGAALLARSVQMLEQIPVGLDPGNILHVQMRFDDRVLMPRVGQSAEEGSYLEVSPRRRAFLDQLVEKINELPQVLGSTITNTFENWSGFWLNLPGDDTLRRTSVEFVGEDYLKILAVPLVRGRQFQPQDRDGNVPVAIVSQALAHQLWGEQDPLGKQLKVQVGRYPEARWATVVGIAANTQQKTFGSLPRQIVYLPDTQFPKKLQSIVASMAHSSLLVRTSRSPSAVVPEVRKIIASLSKEVALTSIEPLAQTLNRRHSETYGFSRILIGLGAVALFLALFGVFGVAAHSVRIRLPELAVRRALGAKASHVLWTVVRNNLVIIASGLPVGAVLGLWLSRYLDSVLFGVSALDPVSYLLAAALIGATFLVAVSIPVGRVLRIRPAAILREI